MKIIAIDNFGRPEQPERQVCCGINDTYGNHVVKFLNDKFSGKDEPFFFKLVPNDYKLKKGFKGGKDAGI
jgi:hypothetical protein